MNDKFWTLSMKLGFGVVGLFLAATAFSYIQEKNKSKLV